MQTATTTRPKRDWRRFLLDNVIFLTFTVLCVGLALSNPQFLDVSNIKNVLRQISINGVLAIGMTFVILTSGIDLSVGSVLAFGGIVAAMLASSTVAGEYPLYLPLVTGLAAGLVLGLINGFFVAYARVPTFVVTLGMLSAASP